MKLRVLLFMLLTLVVAHPALAQRGMYAVPAQAEMEKYPIMKAGEMTTAKMAELELRPVVLTDTVTVFNYFGKDNRFVYETLRKGTLVFVDKDGALRYKADCTNRIVKSADCPKCLETIERLRADSATNSTGRRTTDGSSVSSVDKSQGFFGGLLRGLGNFALFLLGLALIVLLLGALAYMAIEGLTWLFSRIGGGENTPPPAPTPVVTPPAPTAPAPAPAAQPTDPAPVAPVAPAVVATPAPVGETPAPAAPAPAPTTATASPSLITMNLSPELLQHYPGGLQIRIDRA